MKRNKKWLLGIFACMLSFVLGCVATNGVLVDSQKMVEKSGGALIYETAPILEKWELHISGTAVFDLPPFLEKEEKKSSDHKKKKETKKDNSLKKQMVSVAKNNSLTTNSALKNVTLVVDSMFKDQQLWVSDNADTVFVSTEKYSMGQLERAIEFKKQHPGKKEAIYSEGTSTLFRSTIEDADLGKSRVELLRLFAMSRIINNQQKEHLFYHDSTGFGVYGQIFPNGDTVILRIDTLDHTVPTNLASNNSNVVSTTEPQVQVLDTDTVTSDSVETVEIIPNIDQSDKLVDTHISENEAVKDEVNNTENQTDLTHPRLDKKKNIRDSYIVKHSHNKLKKKESKKKKSFVVHF